MRGKPLHHNQQAGEDSARRRALLNGSRMIAQVGLYTGHGPRSLTQGLCFGNLPLLDQVQGLRLCDAVLCGRLGLAQRLHERPGGGLDAWLGGTGCPAAVGQQADTLHAHACFTSSVGRC